LQDLESILIIGTLLVKITDDAKNKFKSIEYWELGFYWAYSNFLFFLGTVHAAGDYENGVLEKVVRIFP
jgi:hypothetical protein